MTARVEVLCWVQLALPGVSHMAQPGPAILFRVSGSVQGAYILLQLPMCSIWSKATGTDVPAKA